MNNFVSSSNQPSDRALDATRIPITTPLDTFRRFRDDEIASPLLESELEALIPRLQLREHDGIFFYVDETDCDERRDVYPAQRVFFQSWSDPIAAVLALVVRDVSWLSHQ